MHNLKCLRRKGKAAGIFYKTIVLLCILAMLCACQSDGDGDVFRYDIAAPVGNLDPQFATDTDARMILANLYEGLVVQGEQGEILPGVAASYTVSDDGLRYTFSLREDAVWQNGDPVTAEDFSYAFVRLFRDGSPHAENFRLIVGAEELRAGKAQTLPGVTANGAHELAITLTQPDTQFLSNLCDPAAAPCNQKVFTDARGRYGLELDLVCCNGPFTLSRWDEVRVSLQQSETYVSEQPTLAQAVHFYIGRDAQEHYLDGKTDVALLEPEVAARQTQDALHSIPKAVWGLVFNQEHKFWGNAMLRQGMALAVDRDTLASDAAVGFQPTSLLVPDSLCVLGVPYRPLAFAQSPMELNSTEALRLFEKGLELLELQQLPMGTSLLVAEPAETALNLEGLQQGWQKRLSTYVNIKGVSEDELDEQLAAGNYEMAVLPFSIESDAAAPLLEVFSSNSSQNVFGYEDALFDDLLQSAAAQAVPGQAAAKYAQAEMRLLTDAVVVPLYVETEILAIAEGVEGLLVSTFGDRIYFKYAQKR